MEPAEILPRTRLQTSKNPPEVKEPAQRSAESEAESSEDEEEQAGEMPTNARGRF